MKKITILMTTYNGEKYVKKQIDSILKQSFIEWELFLSDDGSSDSTVDILKQYEKDYSNIHVICEDKVHQGPYINVYNMIRYLKEINHESDFYCFSDQDDIWDPDKLEIQYKCLNESDNLSSKPIMVTSNLRLIDGEDKDLGKSMSDFCDIELKNPYNLYFKHRYVWGTTVMFNRYLWNMVVIPNDIDNHIAHDDYYGMYAAEFGEIIYVSKPLVFYRRHGNNVSLAPGEHTIFNKKGIGYFIKYYGFIPYNSLYFVHFSGANSIEAREYVTMLLKGGFKALKYIRKNNIDVTDKGISTFVFKMIYFFGIWKLKKESRELYKLHCKL